MLVKNKVLYSLDDVAIMPCQCSTVKHRNECNPYDEYGNLPIFTSPMPSVVDESNYTTFIRNKITPIIPRTVSYEKRLDYIGKGIWTAVSLNEAEELFNGKLKLTSLNNPKKILIDIANGNMQRLYNLVVHTKQKYSLNVELMVGNVANPDTYMMLCQAGADYVRVSVGSGAACSTAKMTGVFYPLASLIDECANTKIGFFTPAKIVADGGIYEYRDAIKCLALGADYVMMGKRLCACEDSAAQLQSSDDTFGYKKLYFGMASSEGMKQLGKRGQPEGTSMLIDVNGTIKSFAEEFKGYLQSAMSYCGTTKLSHFTNSTTVHVISQNASKRFTI